MRNQNGEIKLSVRQARGELVFDLKKDGKTQFRISFDGNRVSVQDEERPLAVQIMKTNVLVSHMANPFFNRGGGGGGGGGEETGQVFGGGGDW